MKKVIIAALAASTAAIAYAYADSQQGQGHGGQFRAEMREMIEGDGMAVDDLANWMQGHSQARFATLDADSNGTVTQDEFLASVDERAKTGFERMDRNDDGVVNSDDRRGWGRNKGGEQRGHGRHGERRGMSGEDRAERGGRSFTRLDTDGDGSISREEFDSGMEARADRFEERGQRHGMGGGRQGGMGGDRQGGMGGGRHGMGGGMPEEMGEMREKMRELISDGMDQAEFAGLLREGATARFAALDADKNGELSTEEFSAKVAEHAEQMFARMDRNDDGVVTRDDRPRWGGGRHDGGGRHGGGGGRYGKGPNAQE